MPKYEIRREYNGKAANECYQACLQAAQLANYTIVKKRDIASLVICETLIQGNRVNLSLIVSLGKPTNVILNLSSERADEMSLKQEADRVLGILGNQLERR